MKKLWFLPLLGLMILGLCVTASAVGIPGQLNITSISDVNGNVTTLTDDDTSTAWIMPSENDPDLTLNFYNASVGEIWIRSGYAYTQNWYNHYDRPDQVKVTVHYRSNQYTTTYDSYRYRLVDLFQPNTRSDDWNNGYQRLLLPKKYTAVTKIELTIESSIRGYGNAGVAISDIAVANGRHVAATPKSYATATPKPYVVYVTPTPGPVTEPDDEVIYLTPEPDEDTPTKPATPTPLVELITPAVTKAPDVTREPIVYPSDGGVTALLSQRIATRSGPGLRYDEPGSFFSTGDEVKVITKHWDDNNHMWWLQVEFKYGNEWYRAYTPESRVDIDPAIILEEPAKPIDTPEIIKKCNARFGPGEAYRLYNITTIHVGTGVEVYAIENGWAQIDYTDYGLPDYPRRRGWVPLDCLYAE